MITVCGPMSTRVPFDVSKALHPAYLRDEIGIIFGRALHTPTV